MFTSSGVLLLKEIAIKNRTCIVHRENFIVKIIVRGVFKRNRSIFYTVKFIVLRG